MQAQIDAYIVTSYGLLVLDKGFISICCPIETTIEYHKTKDFLYIQQLLEHKNVQNTIKQLVQFENKEFYFAAATTTKEAKELLTKGFEYVVEKNQVMLFRKPKRFMAKLQNHGLNIYTTHKFSY